MSTKLIAIQIQLKYDPASTHFLLEGRIKFILVDGNVCMCNDRSIGKSKFKYKEEGINSNQ